MTGVKNNINNNDALKKIRSKYIIMKIFDNLSKNKFMNIIRYSKKYQKLVNKKLKDYKNEYFKIEIEIIPKENIYGNFINIANKITKENVNIFFNNNNEEIKRSFITKNDNITKIKIIIRHKINSLNYFFKDCKCIKKVNFIKFNKDDIISMKGIFYNCSSLEELNLSNINTNKVTDMSWMFFGCSSLKRLNLSNFNTNNVTDMYTMFYGCSSLEELNLSHFNTNNVTNMCNMFFGCKSLKELNLSNFNTNKVINMGGMFEGCSSLK